MSKFDCILIERGPDDGYTACDIVEITNCFDAGTELLPVLLEGNYSTAFGFMAMPVADEVLSFDVSQGSSFGQEVIAVLDDMTIEAENGEYTFAGVKTRLTR